jgi:hypothetical protein
MSGAFASEECFTQSPRDRFETDEQAVRRLLRSLREKNDELKNLLRCKYPSPEDQRILGIYDKSKALK